MAEYLYHFSEDPTIDVFVPRTFVWADDEAHSPRYWFPRDCPRATWWKKTDITDRVHAIQADWYDRFLECELYAYRFGGSTFRENPGGGGWISDATITPLDVQPVGPLLEKHRGAGIELRVVDDLNVLWQEVIAMADIDFSGIRLRNL